MSIDELYDIAERSGCTVELANLAECDAFTVCVDGKPYSVLRRGLSESEEKYLLAHELGHVNYAGLYTELTPYETISRIEARADRYAFKKLLPIDELKRFAKDNPYCSLSDVAEHFGVSEKTVYRYLISFCLNFA